ncbi:MAG: hypothetical protein KDE31_14955, partial [Caldilineaceae bacterium]|nr:hypothetical protein [Caldilineaceae bacterium]
ILDQLEVDKGKAQGRPRVKFTRIQEMLEALHAEVRIKTEDVPEQPETASREPAAVSEPVVAVAPAQPEVVQPEIVSAPPTVAVPEPPAPAAVNESPAAAPTPPVNEQPARTSNGQAKPTPAQPKSSGGGLGALLKKLFGLR